jgi:hypothetical protein
MASLFNDFRLPDIQTANEALATIFGIVERNAFFFLCGFVVVLYIYTTFLSEIVTKGMKEYRMSSAMKHTNTSSYKEMEKKSRSRLIEKYVPKKKEKKSFMEKNQKKAPSRVFSSREYNPLTGSTGGGGYKPSRRQIRRGG